MSSNKLFSAGPYSGMSYEEIVSADPWYIIELSEKKGNHGISSSLVARAQRIIEENQEPEDMEDDNPFEDEDLSFIPGTEGW